LQRQQHRRTAPDLAGVAAGDTIYAHFRAAGVPDTTPVTIGFLADDQQTVLFEAEGEWELGTNEQCIEHELKVDPEIKGAYAVLIIGPRNEITVINPVRFG